MNDFEKRFLGAWRLHDYKIKNLNAGEYSYPFGKYAQGHILYTKEGVMSATLLNPSRKLHTTDRIRRLNFKKKIEVQGLGQLTDEENLIVLTYLEAAYGYVGYTGTFNADGENVYHHVENSFYPNFNGNTLKRNYNFVDDELHLTAVGNGLQDELIWKRMNNAKGGT